MSDVPTTNSVSLVIRNELKANNVRFHANDNIHHIFEANNRLPELEKELTKKFEEVLDTLIIDRENDPNSQDTANRLARMYLYEIMAGRYLPPPKMTTFPNEGEEKYDGLLSFVQSSKRSVRTTISRLLVWPISAFYLMDVCLDYLSIHALCSGTPLVAHYRRNSATG